MNNCIKTYKFILKTVGPVFIGDGKEIGKKEYVFLGNRGIGIFDEHKIWDFFNKKGIRNQFEEFMISNNRDTMYFFLKNNGLSANDIKQTFKYELNSGDAININDKNITIQSFVKDPYGCPYIPGSSLKGLLRTILLSYEIRNNPKLYEKEKNSIIQNLNNSAIEKINRNAFLKTEINNIEAIAFRKLNKSEKKLDAVNDILQGLIVSDSRPLNMENMILVQRIEYNINQEEKILPMLREMIQPGIAVEFDISIDSSTCYYSKEEIVKAINEFNDLYYQKFTSKFKMDKANQNSVILGGNAGFHTKTIINSIFDEDNARLTACIFEKTKVPTNHKHYLDHKIGVSPHILKCARINGKLLQIGMCECEIN